MTITTPKRDRNYRDAAQGVERWYRELGGRCYMFTYVVRGWWGVGQTGQLNVYRAISNGDCYVVKKFYNVSGDSGWSQWAGYSKA